MKYFVWLASLSLLVLGIYCGTMVQVNQPVQAAMLSEGSFPTPDMHQGSPAQLAAERGEGSYPTPGCSPSNPNCRIYEQQQPKLQAGEGSYPTPGCSPSNPNCRVYETPRRMAKLEFLGEGSAPAPFELPGGMN
jgi:hypothetical protein